MAIKKNVKVNKPEVPETPPLDIVKESLTLGHLVKYNLYLLTKSILFSAILAKSDGDVDKAAAEANRIIGELDLDTKKRLEQQQ